MNDVVFEVLVVLMLILLNGFFSGAELAFISLRKSSIQGLVKKHNKKALLVGRMLENPERFLATIQVGITIVSTIASAFAGASIAGKLAPYFEDNSWILISENAHMLSFIIIVLGITYFSIVIGELIPKSLGMKYSKKFAFFAIYPIYFLSIIGSPVTWFLTASSNVVLKIFHDKTSFSEAAITEEELRAMIYESHKAGVIQKHEREMLDNIFDFNDIAVGQVITPRSKIFAINLEKADKNTIKSIIDSEYTRVPFYKKSLNNIVGILNIKDLLTELQKDPKFTDLEKILNNACFIPEDKPISQLLKIFKKGKMHMAIVVNQKDKVVGLVTIEDLLEEIVGDIADETDDQK
ncbi:HlyC/CorC family transporter [Candidatus Gracilibacteria bacterium]|nr:HlyC/CorC family transporter [Candidatus Gracilibacteria bacterium]